MGIFCEICVNQLNNVSTFITTGSEVNGTIKYAFDDKTSVTRICVSFVGYGQLDIRETSGSGDSETTTHTSHTEQFVNIENLILSEKQGKDFPKGIYETCFTFKIPKNVPSSLRYHKKDSTDINCKIKYLIKIKFEFASLFKFNKTFQREIKVESGITPRLPMEPQIYGDRKNLFQLFGNKDNVISLKASIQRSVIEPGGKIVIHVELKNNSNKTVQGVKIKLVEIYTFNKKSKGSSPIKKYENIDCTKSRTAPVNKGKSLAIPFEINVPPHLRTLDYSKIVQRDFEIVIKVELPTPHRDMVLHIPVQIGNILNNEGHLYQNQPHSSCSSSANAAINESSGPPFIPAPKIPEEPPPSYWEAMNECIDKVDKK